MKALWPGRAGTWKAAVLASALAAVAVGPAWAAAPGGDGGGYPWLLALLTYGSMTVWVCIIALAAYAVFFEPRPPATTRAQRIAVWAAIVAPTLAVSALLVFGLSLMMQPGDGSRTTTAGEPWQTIQAAEQAAERAAGASDRRG